MGHADYRKLNDRSQNSSTYHKKDGTNTRAKLKEEMNQDFAESLSFGKLYRTKCYLMGAMEYVDSEGGRSWRDKVKSELSLLGITCFDPYHKPFVNEIKEDEEARADLKEQMENGEFDKVAERMKQVRSDDLRLCDLSDFGIAYLNPQVPTYGTVEEISWFVRCKKPLFIIVNGGKSKCPLWVMGMIPHHYIYNSVEDALSMINMIDRGLKEIDSKRWRLLKHEYR